MTLKSDWDDDDWFASSDQNDVANAINQNTVDLAAAVTALSGKADKATTISAGTGLTGGGTLAANRTLAADFGTGAGKVCEGNDSRLSDARTPTAHTHSGSDITTGSIDIARLGTGRVAGSVNGTSTSLTLWTGTEAQYAAIGTKNPATVYVVTP